MVNAGESERPAARRGSLQVSLAALIVLVLAAGVAAAVARGARDVWGDEVIATARTLITSSVPLARTTGLALEVAAIFLIVILARSILVLVRALSPAESILRIVRTWPVFWRSLAIGFLLWFISNESQLLRVDLIMAREYNTWVPGWALSHGVRQDLFPVCALMAMIGLMLGMGAGRFLNEARPPGRRPVTLFVVLAGLAGVLIMAASDFYAQVTYLVVNALEAVTNAMNHRLVPGPGLSARLLAAGVHAGLASIACLGLAVVLGRDFDRAGRGESWATTKAEWFLRLVLLAAAACLGLHVALVSIPLIHAYLAEGFQLIVGRTEVAMIVCGFGLFAAGLAARTLFPRPAGQSPLGFRVVSSGIRWTILGVGILCVMVNASGSPAFGGSTRGGIRILSLILTPIAQRLRLEPEEFVDDVTRVLAPTYVLWAVIGMGMILLLCELAIRPATAVVAPFDRLASEPAIAPRFIWLVTALVVVCLAALPTILVAGLTLVHLRVFAGAPWLNGLPI
jgi:hypothetical protein